MTNPQNESQALGDLAARQLANATKTNAQLETITPRWLLDLLQWVPVEAGIYRVNRVANPDRVSVHVAQGESDLDGQLPQTYVDYETHPREFTLRPIATTLDIQTRVSDLYSSPHNQVAEQLRLTIETIKEHQESALINNPEYGLLAQAVPEQRVATTGPLHPGRPRRADHQGLEVAGFFSPTRSASPRSAARPPAAVSRQPRSASSARSS